MPNRQPFRTSIAARTTRKKGPSAEEWNRVKPMIRRYYIDERRTLREVRALLLSEHEFDAAIHMLKEKLTQWEFKKNFKKEELETAAKEMKRCADLGMNVPVDMDINGRPCAWDRVYRHYGREYNCSPLRNTSGWDAVLSRVALKTTPTEYDIEASLREVKNYWSTTILRDESRASLTAKRRTARTRHDPHNIEIGFLEGLMLINKGLAEQGWQEISEMCDEVVKVIRLQEPSLLLSIISLFSSVVWIRHHDLFLLVAKYVLATCETILKLSHPLTTILKTLFRLPQTAAVVDDFAELAYQVMVDTAKERRDHVKLRHYYIYCVEEYLIDKIMWRLPRQEAYELIETKLSYNKRNLGPRSRHTLSMQHLLATMYIDDGREERGPQTRSQKETEDKGKTILLEIVEQGQKYPDDRYRVGTYSLVVHRLARFYFAKQDFRNAQKYYCKALLWGAAKFGRLSSHVSLILREFRALQRMGELGLVDIEMPEDVKRVQNAEGHRSQDPVNGLVEAKTADGETCDVEDLEFGVLPGTSISSLDADLFDAPAEEGWQDTGNEMIGSELSDLFMGVFDQNSRQQPMPDAQDAYTSTVDSLQIPTPDPPADVGNEVAFDGLQATPTQDLLEFFPDDIYKEDMQMEGIDQLLEGH